MEGEIKKLISACFLVIASLSYCYFFVSKFPKGKVRLLSLLPILYLFSILPSTFSTVHLQVMSGFFLAWLGNFKLLLFSFNEGPLSTHRISFLNFISTASLPVKSKNPQEQRVNPISPNKVKETKEQTSEPISLKKFPLGIAIKGLLLAFLIHLYQYKTYLHDKVLLITYCLHLYLTTEVVLAAGAALAGAMVGFELELQFNEPYLSTSLQDFWGRRWNLMVPNILRPTVYDPVLQICTRRFDNNGAKLVGVMATFFVSAVMHEILFYYVTKVPTWEMGWFFILHGMAMLLEICTKKSLSDMWALPVVISRVLTIGFVAVTGVWLFFPPIIRRALDEQVIEECRVFLKLLEENSLNLIGFQIWRRILPGQLCALSRVCTICMLEKEKTTLVPGTN